MDFHNLRRRELQALCKKHKIPANLSNLEMINKLSALLTGNEMPSNRGRRSCLKGLDENESENGSDVENRPAKKVRFSPQNELIEFEKSEVKNLERRGRARRKSVVGNNNNDTGVVEHGGRDASVDEGVGRSTNSRRGKVVEGIEVDSKGGKRSMEDDASKDKISSACGVVVRSGHTVIIEGAGRVTRSTKVKLIEVCQVESKGGKRGIKGDVLKDKLPSPTDNVPLLDLNNEMHVVVGKRSLRNRVVDMEKRENDIVEKGCKKNEEQVVTTKRSLRNVEQKDEETMENEDVKKDSRKNGCHRKGIDGEYIDGTKATEEESVGVQAEKVLRRSRRHVSQVDYCKMVNEDVRKNEKVGQVRLRSMVTVDVKEGSGADNISVMKEGSSADINLRRSKRNGAKSEDLVTIERTDEVVNANDRKETKKRRREDAVLQEKSVKFDGNSVERPVRRSTRNAEKSETVAPTTKRGKIVEKEKGRSKKTKAKFEDSSTEEILTSEDLPGPEAELMAPEVAKDTVMENCDDTMTDSAGRASDFENADASEPIFSREDQVSGAFVENANSPLTENGQQKQGGETYTDKKRQGGNDSEQALSMKRTPLSLNDVDETYSVRKFTKEQQVNEIIAQESGQLNLEEGKSWDRENSNPRAVRKVLHAVTITNAIDGNTRDAALTPLNYVDENEPVATANAIDGTTRDAALSPSNYVDENEHGVPVSNLHSTETLKQIKESMSIQRNSHEADNLSAADTDSNHHQLTSFVCAKSEEVGHSKIECDSLDAYWQPSASDAIRISVPREQQDGNVGSGEEINQPDDLQARISVATPISTKPVETAVELKDDINCEVAGESGSTMDLEIHSELGTPSPSEQGKGIDAELFEDGHSLEESSNYKGVGHLKQQDEAINHSWQSPELKSSAKFKSSGVQDPCVPCMEDSVDISDTQGAILPLHSSEVTQIPKGEKCTGIEISASKPSLISSSLVNSSSMQKHQASGSTTESEHCPMPDSNAENQGYVVGSKVERKEESVPTQESYRTELPSSSDDGNLEICNILIDGRLNETNDQLESVAEGLETKGNFESALEAGQDSEPINLESNCIELENHHNLIDVSEVATTGVVDFMSVAVYTPSKSTDENRQGELTSTMPSGKTSKQREESAPGQKNGCEAHNQSLSETIFDDELMSLESDGDGNSEESAPGQKNGCEAHNPPLSETIVDNELMSLEYAESDGDGNSEDQFDTSDKFHESVPDAFRRSTRKVLQDVNVDSGESFVHPSDLRAAVFAFTPESATTVETAAEFSEGLSDLKRVESPNSNFNVEFPGAFTDNLGSVKQSVLKTQSPRSKQRKNVDGGFVVEAFTEFEDRHNHTAAAKFLEVGNLKDQETAFDNRLQQAGLDSSARCTFSCIQDEDVSSAEDTVEADDSHFGFEANTSLEDGHNRLEVAKIEDVGHIKDQHTALNYCLQLAELDSSARSKFSFMQDQGVSGAVDTGEISDSHLSPPILAVHISEERREEIELSARRCSSTSKTPPNSSFISECQREGLCREGERNAESDPTQELDMMQMPSTKKRGGLERSSMCKAGSGVMDVLNVELGSTAEVMEPNANHVFISEPDIGKEMQESCISEKGGLLNLEATAVNLLETHSVESVLEDATIGTLDSCSLHAAQTPSKDSNRNELGESFETLLFEPVSVSSTREEINQVCSLGSPDAVEGTTDEWNLSNRWHGDELKMLFDDSVTDHESNIVQEEHYVVFSNSPSNIASAEYRDFLVLSNDTPQQQNEQKNGTLGRDGRSGQSDEVLGREEQDQDTSGHKDYVGVVIASQGGIQNTNQQNTLPDAVEGTTGGWNLSNSWHGDELKMLFGDSVTGHGNNNIVQERDDVAISNSTAHVASNEYGDDLVLSNGTPPHHDEQKVNDSGILMDIEVGGDNSKEEHAECGAEMNIPPEESKGDASFSFDQNKDVEEETGTSAAMLVGEEVTMLGIDPEVKVGELGIQDSAASASSISKSTALLKEKDTDRMIDFTDSESTETLSLSNNKQSDVITEDAELTPLVELNDEQEQGQAREEANRVLDDVCVISKTNSSSISKHLDAVAEESIKSPAAKQFMSTMKRKNARTILIHGTPNKLQMTADMKENAPNSKLENVGTWTTVRPAAKRPALKDLHK